MGFTPIVVPHPDALDVLDAFQHPHGLVEYSLRRVRRVRRVRQVRRVEMGFLSLDWGYSPSAENCAT
jgi:hypothetical protein